MSCGGEHQPQGEWTKQLLLGAESRPPGDLQQDLLSCVDLGRLNLFTSAQQEVRGGTSDSTSSIRLYSNTKQHISHQSRTTLRVSDHTTTTTFGHRHVSATPPGGGRTALTDGGR